MRLTPDSRERFGQIPELQSIRGLAALAVAAGHALSFYRQPSWWPLFALIFNGRMAVVLFFVLSGFVLTRALRGSTLQWVDLGPYWIRRVLRIYPAIWAVSVMSLAYVHGVHWRLPVPAGMSDYYLSRFAPERMRPVYIIASFGGALAYLIPQLWSVFIEICASAALPFIAVLARHRRKVFYGLGAVALAASFGIGGRSYYAICLYGFDFFVGAWLATPEPKIRKAFSRLAPVSGPVMLALAVAALTSQFLPLAYYSPFAALYEAALAALLIGLIVYGGAQIRLLQHRWMVWLGDVSYSVYLLHYLVACLIVHGMDAVCSAAKLDLPSEVRALILCILTLTLTLFASPILYAWVERPGIAAGKWLSTSFAAFVARKAISEKGAALQAETTPP